MGDGDTIPVHQEANLYLGPIRPMVSGMAFKIGRGEVIEDHKPVVEAYLQRTLYLN
jgi:hypothetical protein